MDVGLNGSGNLRLLEFEAYLGISSILLGSSHCNNRSKISDSLHSLH